MADLIGKGSSSVNEGLSKSVFDVLKALSDLTWKSSVQCFDIVLHNKRIISQICFLQVISVSVG